MAHTKQEFTLRIDKFSDDYPSEVSYHASVYIAGEFIGVVSAPKLKDALTAFSILYGYRLKDYLQPA